MSTFIFNNKPAANDTAEIDQSISKIAIFAIFGTITFFSFGLFLKLFFSGGNFNFLLISISSASIFLIVFLLQSLFIKNFLNAAFVVFFECLGLFVGFYDRISNPMIIGSAFFVFLILFLANQSGRQEIRNAVKISFRKIGKATLPKAIAIIVLFSSIVYVSANEKGFFISQSNFEKILLPAAAIIKRIYPAIDFSLPIKELSVDLASEEAGKLPNFELLPKSERAKIVNQSAKEMEDAISSFFGGEINSTLNIYQISYGFAAKKFNELSKEIQSMILIGVAFMIFLTLEGLAWPFRLIITFLAYIIYEILLALEFATVSLEGISKETVVLK
ncbi:MAG: hypothetical protein AAB464_00890 [Patescibacteria group bacterium]